MKSADYNLSPAKGVQRGVALRLWHERKRGEHVNQILFVELVGAGNAGVKFGARGGVERIGRGNTGQSDDGGKRVGVARWHRHRQLVDDGGRHMRPSAEPDQAGRAETVEDTAQE